MPRPPPPGSDPPVILGFTDDSGISGDGLTNDSTVTLFGTADPGARVNIFINGSKIGHTTADADGNWSVTTELLADGQYEFTVSVGNGRNAIFSETSEIVVIDTVTPEPVISSVDPVSGGVSLAGTAEAGSSIVLYRDGVEVGNTIADGSGAWQIIDTFAGTAATYHVIATDVAGNSDQSADFDYDTQPNTPAVISGDIAGDVTEDSATPASGLLTVTDPDPGEDGLQALNQLGDNGHGTFDVLADGNWSYTLDNGSAAVQALGAGATATDTVTVTSADGSDTEVITVTITGVNDTASISGDSSGSVTEDGTLIASGLVTVADADNGEDAVQVVAAGAPTLNTYGTYEVQANGTWIYTLDNAHAAVQGLGAGQTLTDSFTVVSADGTGSQAVTITINGADEAVNNDPVPVDDSAATGAAAAVVIAVLANDTDPDGDPLTVTAVTDGAGGSVVNNGDGTVTYTPDAGFSGQDIFSYTVEDGKGGSATANVAVTVSELSNGLHIFGLTDASDTGLANDDDITSLNTGFTLTGRIVPFDSLFVSLALTIEGMDFDVTNIDSAGDWSFLYDGQALGDGPITVDGTLTTLRPNGRKEQTQSAIVPYVFQVDTMITDPVIVSAIRFVDDVLLTGTAEADSIVTVFRDSGEVGTTTTDEEGDWQFIDEFGGSAATYYVTSADFVDNVAQSEEVTYTPLNFAPDAVDDSPRAFVNTALDIAVTLNDVDQNGDPITVTSASDGANGTVVVAADNFLTYTPNADFSGSDSFIYAIDDGYGGQDSATVNISVSVPSFEGAEGYGAFATGGRGGQIIKVTNSNDSGIGSLRWALEQVSGPRIIVFEVNEVNLDSSIVIRDGDVTIAGQTAGGVQVAGAPLRIVDSNVIIQGIMFRPGDAVDGSYEGNRDALTIGTSSKTVRDIYIDHNSFEWGIDENVTFYRHVTDVTFSNNIVAQALHDSIASSPSGTGLLLHAGGGTDVPERITIANNILAFNYARNPWIKHGEEIEFVNNYIYAPAHQHRAMDLGDHGSDNFSIPQYMSVSLIGNVYEAGQETRTTDFNNEWQTAIRVANLAGADFYIDGNLLLDKNGQLISPEYHGSSSSDVVDAPAFAGSGVTILDAAAVKAYVLANAGATPGDRDEVDQRIIDLILSGQGGIINSVEEAGGWGTLPSLTPPLDSDNDGLPDDYEDLVGTDKTVFDAHEDLDNDHFTNMDEYLSALIDDPTIHSLLS